MFTYQVGRSATGRRGGPWPSSTPFRATARSRPGLIPLGTIDSGLQLIADAGDAFQLRIEALDWPLPSRSPRRTRGRDHRELASRPDGPHQTPLADCVSALEPVCTDQSPQINEEDAMNPTYDFTAQVALVTGGSSGMGLATARAFAQAGASVVIADLDQVTLAAAPRS